MTTRIQAEFEEDYYARNYSSYELQNPPHKLAFYRDLVKSVTAGSERPRILDMGCAFGSFLSLLDPDWERFGVDVSRFAIEEARRRLPGATFARVSGTDIPFDGYFDVIVAFDVLEHIPSLAEVRSSLHSKLAVGGHFILVVPVYDGPTSPLIRLLDKDETHVHKQSRWFWLEWTNKVFQVTEWWGIYRFLFPRGRYLHWPTKSFRRFTPAVAIVARRERN